MNIHKIEITKGLFNKIVTPDTKCHKIENLEYCNKFYYVVEGVLVLRIDNFLSCVTQYYIQDINQ